MPRALPSSWWFVASVGCLLIVSCGHDPDVAARRNAQLLDQAAPRTRVFSLASSAHEFLDPARIAETAGQHLMLNVFEGLYTYNRGDGPPVPAMATHHEQSPDGLVWTFHLREGLVWSDGTALTARDFVWSWRRVLDPKTASRSAQLLWFIKGAKAFHAGETTDPETIAVHALDGRTLQVTLDHPTPFFDELVCELAYAPTPRHVVERWGLDWTRPEHLVSNGPFLLVEDQPRVRATLRRNHRYFDASSVFLDEVRVLLSDDDQTALDWYEVGRTQWLGDRALPIDKVPSLLGARRVDLRSDPKLCTYYYSLRVDRPPLNDPRVRRALMLAIDRERLSRHVLRGGQPAAGTAMPDLFGASHGYHALQVPSYDVERAQQLLAEAGYPKGVGLPPIELLHNTGDGQRLIAEVIQRDLWDHLGVRVTVASQEWGSMLKRLLAGDFAIGRSSWCADYPDPLTFLEVFRSDAEANYSGYRSPEFDATVDAIRAETRRDPRNALIRKAEVILDRDLPYLPMFHYTNTTLVRPYVIGLEPHREDKHPLKYVRWATSAEWLRIRSGERIHLPPFAVAAPAEFEGPP